LSRGEKALLFDSEFAKESETAIQERETRTNGKDFDTKRSIPSLKLINRPVVIQ
jgi:hypothetical protein